MSLILWMSLFFSSTIVNCREEWIDPYDMNNKRSSQNIAASNNCDCPAPVITKSEYECPHSSINFAISHYKRTISLLLSAVAIDRTDKFNYKGELYINIPQEDYDKLQSFAKSNAEDSTTLRTIDQILSRILIKPLSDRFTESLISWTDHMYFTFYNRTTGVLLACTFLLFISYKLLKANLTIWTVTKYLIFLGFVIDFAFTWINLLQDAEINKLADSLKYSTIPTYCDPNKMSTWQYIKYFFGTTDTCREYHQTMLKDHFWSIGPVTVLSHQFGTLVLTPASYIGMAMGKFTNGILSTLPWGVNVVLLPILLIFTALIVCILFSFVTQTSFSCNIFHVVKLEFGKNERQAVGDVLSGRNLSAIINTVHRNMIEEVRQANTLENAVSSEVSNFREASTENHKNEPKNNCDSTKKEGVSKSSVSRTLDGSGDQIVCIDN